MSATLPPLSLYVHIPWCVRKCPYCDFNSHTASAQLPESDYVSALLSDLSEDIAQAAEQFATRPLQSIFFGGGTPSLFSSQAIAAILQGVKQRLPLAEDCEITLEANPGASDEQRFNGYFQAGVNRLSLGIQSFNPQHLQSLGRIHNTQQACTAITAAKQAGFDNFNLDLMHGLPSQTVEQACEDLRQALSFQPSHISWYQLTIEPNTVFYKQPPLLPEEDLLADIQEAGEALLTKAGFQHYEISAWSQPGKQATHNRNYWLFGDYLGIGAGAHSKISYLDGRIVRRHKTRKPEHYLATDKRFVAGASTLAIEDLSFEFMLNALRLSSGFSFDHFEQVTGLERGVLQTGLQQAQEMGLLSVSTNQVTPTPLGIRFHNNLVNLFQPAAHN